MLVQAAFPFDRKSHLYVKHSIKLYYIVLETKNVFVYEVTWCDVDKYTIEVNLQRVMSVL